MKVNRFLTIGLRIGVFSFLLSGCYADLRTSLVRRGDQEGVLERGGRVVFAEALKRQGGINRWKQHQTYSVELRDRWCGTWDLFNPWPKNNQLMRFDWQRGTNEVRVEFLDGEMDSGLWGLEKGKSYRREPEQKKADFEDDSRIKKVLPIFKLFFEMPFRLSEMKTVQFAGINYFDYRPYDLVFIATDQLGSKKVSDQYLVYIDRKSGLIEKVTYTVRELARSFQATVHFSDYRDVEGLLLPFKIFITPNQDGEIKDCVHQLNIENVEFDVIEPSELVVSK